MLNVIQLPVGPLQTNCYLLYDDHSKDCIIIDPGDEASIIAGEINASSLKPQQIIITHGHFDHISAVEELKQLYGIPVSIHKEDLPIYMDPNLNGANFFTQSFSVTEPDNYLAEDDIVSLNGSSLTVLHTPGHSPGSISLYYADKFMFVGDLIFLEGVGRADLHGGDWHTLIASIRNKILPLKPEIILYNGHGPATTIGREIRFNPFLQTRDT